MDKKVVKKRFLSKFDGKKQEWLHIGVFLVLMLLAAFVLFQLIFGVSTVTGDSMEPNYHEGDVVVYLRVGDIFKVGDVVAVSMPSGECYIKRVAGLPGDVLDISNGKLLCNNTPEAQYGQIGSTDPQVDTVVFPLTVGEGRYFVLGDNRETSVDSRTFGTVSAKQIRGRVLFALRRER